jgi:hypothetical protein
MPHFARDRQPISLSNGELHYPHRFFILELSCAFFFLHLLRMCDKLIGVPLLERQNEAPHNRRPNDENIGTQKPVLTCAEGGAFMVWLFCCVVVLLCGRSHFSKTACQGGCTSRCSCGGEQRRGQPLST